MNLKINDVAVRAEKGQTILQAARSAGIDIPTLCHLEGIHETGACRICVVEIKGSRNLVPSCITKVQDGMEIRTNSPRVRRARKTILELILSDHPDECLSCRKSDTCELNRLADKLNIRRNPYEGEYSRCHIDDETPSIVRDSSKCVLCRRCISVCGTVQGVSAIAPIDRGFDTVISPAGKKSLADSPCVLCGQCIKVCPTGALLEKSDVDRVWDALANENLHVVVQAAPAVRVAIGEMFGYAPGTPVTGKMVTALKQLGFDRVFDTNFTADLTILEEGNELLHRVKNGLPLPMITSCSPGWINYLEYFYPSLIGYVSTCKSPQQMFGTVIKTYYSEKMGIPAEDIFTVSIMPCTAKKYEAQRPEMHTGGIRDIDAVLTTRELGNMLKEAGINLETLPISGFDEPFGAGSGAGAIFGNTGGVMEAALRTVYEVVTGKPLARLEFEDIRGLQGIKETSVTLNGLTLNAAVIHGLGNVRDILDDIASGISPYHFIEVMCCPGGCIGGGGQPISRDAQVNEKRIRGLYREDESLPLRKSHDNPAVWELYNNFLGEPLSEKSHRLLHTHYHSRR
jgi:iron-only hydrogenase group A